MGRMLVWFVVLFPLSVFAASGACSSHGGVSCSAGSDWDGSVICNDGWRDSSVSYSSMEMCEVPTISCPRPFIIGATNEELCNSFQAVCDKFNASKKQSCLVSGMSLDNPICAVDDCPNAVRCRSEVASYKEEVAAYDECIADRKKLQELQIQKAESDIRKIEESIKKKEKELKLIQCQGSHGTQSVLDWKDDCSCSEGYTFGNYKKCVSKQTYCEQKYGKSAVYIKESELCRYESIPPPPPPKPMSPPPPVAQPSVPLPAKSVELKVERKVESKIEQNIEEVRRIIPTSISEVIQESPKEEYEVVEEKKSGIISKTLSVIGNFFINLFSW